MSSDDRPRAWHRDVVETAPVPVVVYDADGVLQQVNRAAAAFVNAETPDAVVGRPAVEFVAPADREQIGDRVRRVIAERESVPPAEAAFVAVDGERKHAVTAGAPVTYEGAAAGQAILNDITERKERERRIERERDRFETLFENLPSPVTHSVVEDGEPIVEAVNARFEAVFGHDRTEIEGERLDAYIVPSDRQAEAERINRRVLEEERVRTEVRRQTADGVRDFLLHVVRHEPDPAASETYAIYVDVTEQKRTRRQLRRQNERLDEFASVVAHDLRNPLSVAKANLALAREGSDEGDLDGIARAHDRMERIIDDLLTLARQGRTVTDPEPTDLGAVAREAWGTTDTGDADLRVEERLQMPADGDRLRYLFENLFRNSVEHSRPQADDAAERSDDAVTVTVGPLSDAEGFYVADTGPGIPADDREQVFESGYTTNDEGTGFGLSIVRRIAEAHGWRVSVTDSEAGGARFEFAADAPAR